MTIYSKMVVSAADDALFAKVLARVFYFADVHGSNRQLYATFVQFGDQKERDSDPDIIASDEVVVALHLRREPALELAVKLAADSYSNLVDLAEDEGVSVQ